MKRIGKKLTFLTVMLTLLIAFPALLSAEPAAGADGPAVYAVSERQTGGPDPGLGTESEWKYDYLALNEDRTGVFLYNQAAFRILWEEDDGDFRFTDHLGNEFSGTFDGSTITGGYGNYRYTFQSGDWTLPAWTISSSDWNGGLSSVTDQAQALSDSQREAFAQRAKELTDKYDVGVYIVFLDRWEDFTWTGSIETLSEEIRAGYAIGIGDTDQKAEHGGRGNAEWKDSVLLTVSIGSRKYDMCVSGNYADWAFSKYAREKVREDFVDDFKENDWAGGIDGFLDGVEKVLDTAAKGHSFSFRYDTPGRLISILAPVVLALIFGYGTAAAVRSSMQNTQKAQNAAAYVAGDQVNFKRREDRYIRTVVSRVYSPREKSSGSGGGGHSSSGSSHTSGSF